MKPKKENIEQQISKLSENLEIKYSKSKEEIWASLSKNIDTKHNAKTIAFSFTKISIAAAITILVSFGVFMKLYTKEITSKKGMHLSYELPDGSIVNLNADSKLEYAPYWWGFERQLVFEGEAFFEVKKGSNFSVNSELGKTEVLGTSFNISTRNNRYSVYCKTGKVRVSSTKNGEKVVLTPNMLAELNNKFIIKENVVEEHILGWIRNEFKFSSTPLAEVFSELERQYDIKIETDIKTINKIYYSGFFKKQKSPESTLKLICSTFDFTFEKHDNRVFKIVKKK